MRETPTTARGAREDVWSALRPLLERLDAVDGELDDGERDVGTRYLNGIPEADRDHLADRRGAEPTTASQPGSSTSERAKLRINRAVRRR